MTYNQWLKVGMKEGYYKIVIKTVLKEILAIINTSLKNAIK